MSREGDQERAAVEAALARLERWPLDPTANQVLGAAALARGDAAAAMAYYEQALLAAPSDPHLLNALGIALRRLGQLDDARAKFVRAGELGLAEAWRNLGDLEDADGALESSILAYQRSLALAPNEAAPHGALAVAFERRHDLARAKAHAESALALNPHAERARIALARVLLREGDPRGAEAAATPVTESPSPMNRALAWGLLGEALEARNDAAAAFAAFTAANRILLAEHRAALENSRNLAHPEVVQAMSRWVTAVDASPWRAPPDARAPVFLIGFPRSGTTLLDQILSSHSEIVCVEEREHLATVIAPWLAGKSDLALMPELTDAEAARIRSEYWNRLLSEKGATDRPIVIDKMPLNVALTLPIKRIFPNAKLILALRDPRDVILSCYQQRFGMNAAMAQFLQLETAAGYYDAVMGLFELCRQRLDLELCEVRYEDVVADLECAGRKVAAFLGVSFEARMLDFSATARSRVIGTPSARQVVQPLYRSSVGRWRRYSAQLEPVAGVLAPWVRRFGYAD